MSAPRLRLHPDLAEAMAQRVVEQDALIQRLTEENDDLEEAKLAFEVRASLRFSLLERRCKALEDKLDGMSQHMTVLLMERDLGKRTPEQEESLNDQREAHRAWENNGG